jgi:hypothetical protein
MKNFRMCGLHQGAQKVVGWIEERGAKLNAMVEIPELGGLWKVVGVGETLRTQAEVQEAQSRARQPFTALKSYR